MERAGGKELDTSKVNNLASSIKGLQIVGIRSKPPGVTEDTRW